jgi:nucleoside-diphosphate kinase
METTMDRTLVIVKPDGVARGLVGRILTRLEDKGIFIVALKMLRLDEAAARKMYSVHKGKDFYEPLIKYVTAGPVVALVAEGKGVVEMVRALAGPTFGSAAPAGTIRGDLAVSNRYNIVHASDSRESYERERPVFFAEGEIMSLDKTRLNWVYDTSAGKVI